MHMKEFLQAVITTPEGYFCFAFGDGGTWKEDFYKWPDCIDEIVELANKYKDKTNVYFSSYLFSEPRSLKNLVLPSRTIQADLDNADIALLPLIPSVLVQTSPGRHQAYWFLDKALPIEIHEILSRKLTYSITGCDHSGWPLGRKVRIIETLNRKYLEGPFDVSVIGSELRVYTETDLELLPDVTEVEAENYDDAWLDNPHEDLDVGPLALLESIKKSIPNKVYIEYNLVSLGKEGRSGALWALMCAAFRAGLTREQVFYLAKYSKNNKFADLKFNGDRELAKDVARAEATIKTNIVDMRAAITDARKLKGNASEKRQYMFAQVWTDMAARGEFVNTTGGGAYYYIDKESGRPIMLSTRSEQLEGFLDRRYGLNASETDQNYIIHSLISYCMNLPPTTTTRSLSHLSLEMNSLFVHTGKKDVIKISKDDITKIVNGSYGVIFPWLTGVDTFNPDFSSHIDWADIMFSRAIENVINIPKDEAFVLLKAWLIFLLMRNISNDRPLLALFGAPGSGKSTLLRCVYALLYGSARNLGGITKEENYDHAVATDPFVALDDLNTWYSWLPDRLSQSITSTDILKRKLWTDADNVVQRRDAMVGITAFNHKFGREDISDRMLIFSFERVKHFRSHHELEGRVTANRNAIWGSLLEDVQKVLNMPLPDDRATPQFRIEDFARIGTWITSAFGCNETFAKGLTHVQQAQYSLNVEEDSLLIAAISNYVGKSKYVNSYITPGLLWIQLGTYSQDEVGFVKRYKSASLLARKLVTMHNTLSHYFSVDWQQDVNTGIKMWRIGVKENVVQDE